MAEKLTKDEAEQLIESWADFMELDTDRELYQDVLEELRYPVRLQKLTFDESTETFTLQLKNKIETKEGEIGLVEIKSCDMASKRVLQKFKDSESIDSARAMLAAYTNLSESDVRKLKDLDINRINTIICGFIQQVQPGK